MIDMVSDQNLVTNFFSTLLGKEKGNIAGKDLLFLKRIYFVRSLKTNSEFYKEALSALANFETIKGIENVDKWDTEHVFYNPIILTEKGKTFILTKYFEQQNVYILDQLLKEKAKQTRHQPFDKIIVKLFDQIHLSASTKKENVLILINKDEIQFSQVTQKILYEEAIMQIITRKLNGFTN